MEKGDRRAAAAAVGKYQYVWIREWFACLRRNLRYLE